MVTYRHVKAGIAALLLACTAQAEPTARDILEAARMNQTDQHRTFKGQLRNGPTTIPFRLIFDGPEVRYEFSKPEETLVLKFGENSSKLELVRPGDRQRVTALNQKVRNTDISYEDLALRFLYWPNATLEGQQTVMTRRCWKLHLEPAARDDSQYGMVLLWVEQESGALLRAEGYDKAGLLSKRFEVRSTKQMRIEQMEKGRATDKTPTYLEIEGL
jgi:hypothetical protein